MDPDRAESSRKVLGGFWAVVMASGVERHLPVVARRLVQTQRLRHRLPNDAEQSSDVRSSNVWRPLTPWPTGSPATSAAAVIWEWTNVWIAPDPWGVPTLYCVQRQNEAVAFGSSGTKKHVARVNQSCPAVHSFGWPIAVRAHPPLGPGDRAAFRRNTPRVGDPRPGVVLTLLTEAGARRQPSRTRWSGPNTWPPFSWPTPNSGASRTSCCPARACSIREIAPAANGDYQPRARHSAR